MSQIEEVLQRYPALEKCRESITATVDALCKMYYRDATLFVCGNGGSAADSEHIVGELMKGFMQKRPLSEKSKKNLITQDEEQGKYIAEHLQQSIPSISLVSSVSLATAFANDVAADLIFAQQVNGLGHHGDILFGISTSGNAMNVVNAMITAKAKGMHTIALTGRDGGRLKALSDIAIIVPAGSTPEIQELHLPVYHYICEAVESRLFCDAR